MIDSIFRVYPQVVRTVGDEAFDVDGNQVTYDLALVQAYEDSIAYIAKRQSEYPPMTDYLDAIVKGDTAQQKVYVDACLAVKAKYPKGVI